MTLDSHPEIGALLEKLLEISRSVLKDNFEGMYVFGSLASGDYSPKTSDIDFVVITRADATENQIAGLRERINELLASNRNLADKLEGSFMPHSAFQEPQPPHRAYPSLSTGGEFSMDHKGIEQPIQRHMLREDGIVLAGPEPRSFVDPANAAELKAATVETLLDWWKPQLQDPFRLEGREYQAYAVLTMCRALYTLRNGSIVSKPAAARWARQALDERWRGLIERSASWGPDDGVDDMASTLEFIQYVLSRLSPSPSP
jgi:predicted nucleotidyltransferase